MNDPQTPTKNHNAKPAGSIPAPASPDNEALASECSASAANDGERRLLVVADSPTLSTGFACVARNLLKYWAGGSGGSAGGGAGGAAGGAFEKVDVWGIGYAGWPHEMPYTIYPAQTYDAPLWHDPRNISRMVKLIGSRRYSHVWIMQDLFLLSSAQAVGLLGEALKIGAKQWGLRSVCYFPVDAPVESWWLNFLSCVDLPVAYTRYGIDEVTKAAMRDPAMYSPVLQKLSCIPHGCDTNVFMPLGLEKTGLRQWLFSNVEWKGDEFVVIAVSANQKRKGLLQTLQVFARVRDMMTEDGLLLEAARLRLYMHMPSENMQEGVDLKQAAHALGLGREVMFGDSAFSGNHALLGENGLNQLYNAADLLLTTTLGEGWGLPITEAMAAGCPVAGPDHTAVGELLTGGAETCAEMRGICFQTALGSVMLPWDNSRIRPLTDVDDAALEITEAALQFPERRSLMTKAARALEWIRRDEFRWENIAAQWVELMVNGKGQMADGKGGCAK